MTTAKPNASIETRTTADYNSCLEQRIQCGMLPEEIFRLGFCILIAVHFLERLRQLSFLLGESDLPKSWFAGILEPVLVIAMIADVLLALGLFQRFSTLLLFGTAVMMGHVVPYFSHLADHIVSIMCLWACVLPLGRSLGKMDIIKIGTKTGRAAAIPTNVPALPGQLFRIQIALLLMDYHLWHANVPGWSMPPVQHAFMALPALLSLLPQFRWFALGLHILMMSLMLFEVPNTTLGLLLLAGIVFISHPPDPAGVRAQAVVRLRPIPLQTVPALSLVLIAIGAASTANHFFDSFKGVAANRLLDDIGLVPPHSPRQSATTQVAVSVQDEDGRKLGQDFDSWHERILISYLTNRPWSVVPSGTDGIIRALIGAHVAQPFCDRDTRGPISLVSREAESTTVLYRFTCPTDGTVRMLPRDDDKGDLPLTCGRGFEVPNPVPSWINSCCIQ